MSYLGNSYSQENPKETQWLKAIWYLGWDPGTEQGHKMKVNKIWTGCGLHNTVSILVNYNKCIALKLDVNYKGKQWRIYLKKLYCICNISINLKVF